MVSYVTEKDAERILSIEVAKLAIDDFEGEDGATKCKLPAGMEVATVEETECKTPTAKEARIPETLTCPPAPRKRKLFGDGSEPEKMTDVKEKLLAVPESTLFGS
ncbi:hypothetical protein SLE2022_330610 [Rubroshorea leprosula]